MHVPKAAVHVDDLAKPWKYEIRGTGKRADVKSESISERMGDSTDTQLRSRILGLNRSHDSGTFRLCKHVGHLIEFSHVYRIWEQNDCWVKLL